MYKSVEKLRERAHLPAEGNYLVGLSGGADSVALLLMLLPDIRENRIQVEAVHVNHGLRGAESDEDERFAAALCEREGILFRSFHPALDGRKDEATARAARMGCFRRALQETGARAVLLAHHADDQAETFLMHLMRGAGPEGLEGMKRVQESDGMRIIRPMLELRRKEIREALQKDGVNWREDSSNRDTAYLRNRVRLELLPLMEEITEGVTPRICTASRLISEDNDALTAQASDLCRKAAAGDRIAAKPLMEAPNAVLSRTLRMWWRENSPERKERALSAVKTAELAGLLRKEKGSVNLPGNMHAVRSKEYLHLTTDDSTAAEPAAVTGAETRFQNYLLKAGPSEGNPGNGLLTQEVPAGFTDGCVVRNRQPGDRIHPFGSNGSRKLQDYLTDRKIPRPFRDRIPLLCRGQEVLLVCGVGAGQIPDWNPEGRNIRLTWYGDIPWLKQKRGETDGAERSDLPGS